jgi:hypothetical protein
MSISLHYQNKELVEMPNSPLKIRNLEKSLLYYSKVDNMRSLNHNILIGSYIKYVHTLLYLHIYYIMFSYTGWQGSGFDSNPGRTLSQKRFFPGTADTLGFLLNKVRSRNGWFSSIHFSPLRFRDDKASVITVPSIKPLLKSNLISSKSYKTRLVIVMKNQI